MWVTYTKNYSNDMKKLPKLSVKIKYSITFIVYLMAGGIGLDITYPYRMFFHQIAANLPNYTRIYEIIYQMGPDTTIEQLYPLLDDSDFRSYALCHSLCCCNNIELFNQIFNMYTFDPTDDYIILRSIQQYSSTHVQVLINSGFRFDSHGLNPFYLWMKDFELNNLFNEAAHKAAWRIECIKIFDMLIEAGYDIHMNEDMALKHCHDLKILEYMMAKNINMIDSGSEWLSNHIKSAKFYHPYDALKYMMSQGLDIESNDSMLIDYAFENMDLGLIKIIDEHGYDFKKREQRLMNLFGSGRSRGCDYEIIHEIFEILIKHDIDLNMLRSNVFSSITYGHFTKALEALIRGGFNVKHMVSYWCDSANSSKVQMFKLLVENGVDVDAAVKLI